MTMVANGVERLKGRSAPPEKLYEHTFQDTGRTVFVRKLSTFWRDTVRKQVQKEPGFERPQPPIFEHDYGQGKIAAPNYGHPMYQQLMADWTRRVNEAVGERVTQFVINSGVVCDVDEDAVTAARVRAAEQSIDLSDYSDHYVYVAFFCIGSHDDWQDLLRAVFERAAPQEAAVQAYKDTFPGDVQRAGPVGADAQPTAGGDGVPPGI
jgi:hypothetical protein